MHLRYFNFESISGIDENNRVKIELATDTRSDISFSIKYSNIWHIKSYFSIITNFTLLKPANYKRSLIAYKDWYTNELINKVTEDSSIYEKQSKAKKEVLQEAVQRRNKLQNQIDKAMTFYHNNKHKIDEMERIRANNQKIYPGPMMILTDESMIFENVTEYYDIYYQLIIDIPKDDEGENKNGFAWLEFSKGFSEDLHNLSNINSDNVILTNNKPRSDIRVLRRGDKQPSTQYNMDDKFFEGFINSPLYVRLSSLIVNKKFQLSKSQIFTIIDQIVNRYSPNQNLILNITKGPNLEFKTEIKETEISIKLFSEYESTISTQINSSVFLAIKNVTYLIKSVEIHYLGFLFGTNFIINFEGGKLFCNTNQQQSTKARYLREVIRNNIAYVSELEGIQLTAEDLKGNNIHVYPNDKYQRVIDFEFSKQSHREKLSNVLLTSNEGNFTIETDNIQYSDEYKATIELDNTNFPTQWRCECGKTNSVFKCPHLLALFLFGFKEGIFFA